MRQLLRFLLLPLVAAAAAPHAQAQAANPAMWCPPGATWTYGYGLFNEQGTVTVSYARDTVVAGQPAQLLTRRINSVTYIGPTAYLPNTPYNITSVVTRVMPDRVEVLAYGQFHTLYDFAAPVGSSWLTPLVTPHGPCAPSHGLARITVDSVGTQLIGGQVLRWFRARVQAPAGAQSGYWPGRIYEQIGSTQYMQPQSPICHGTDPGSMGGLVSYRATGQPAIGVNSSTGAIVLAAMESRASVAGFTAFPSPGAGPLMLQLPANLHPDAYLRLLDLSGRTLRELPAVSQMDLSEVPAGTYFLRLEQPGAPALSRKIVRE